MRLEVRKLLIDADLAAAAIQKFTQGRTLDDMASDDLFRSAVYMKFVLIGESLSALKRFDESVLTHISESWRIIGFRHQIVHGYEVLRDLVTWQIIQDKLPILRRELAHLLAS